MSFTSIIHRAGQEYYKECVAIYWFYRKCNFFFNSVEWLMYYLQDGLFETWKMLSFGSDTKKNRIIAKIFINFKVLKFL